MTIITLLGLIGNILGLVVLARPAMKSPSNLILICKSQLTNHPTFSIKVHFWIRKFNIEAIPWS